MARIRSVHPDICISARMAALPAHLERTFTRLWTHCDDEGRCPDNPRLIKAAIYPLHDEQTWEIVDAELSLLEEVGLVIRYEVEGVAVVQVRSWSEYQHPQRPSESKLPPPPEATSPLPVVEPSRTSHGTLMEVYVSGEGEGEGVGEGDLAPKPARDEVWDALAGIFGTPTTRSNRSLRGKLVKSLSAAGATAPEIQRRVQAWPLHFPDATLTETALEKHWDRLGLVPARASPEQVDAYQSELRVLQRQRQALDMERGLPG